MLKSANPFPSSTVLGKGPSGAFPGICFARQAQGLLGARKCLGFAPGGFGAERLTEGLGWAWGCEQQLSLFALLYVAMAILGVRRLPDTRQASRRLKPRTKRRRARKSPPLSNSASRRLKPRTKRH